MSVAAGLNINDAMDMVDAYGADPDLWPREHKDDLLEMQRVDEDFADYVASVKRLDDLLNDWGEGDDGVDVGEDTEDDFTGLGDTDSEDMDDEDDEPCSGSDWGDDEDEEETDDVDDFEDEDDGSVIEVNSERLQDMDSMFSDAIQKAFSDGDPMEFRVFTRDYDEIVDITGVDETVSLEGIDQAVAKATGPLQKDLRRLIAARSQVQRVPGMRRGRLHGPNLHRILSGDDRVFTRREEAQSLDTAISLVIDCSGSMAGREMILSTETGYAIASVLSRLGIAFECLGFTDNYNDPRVNNPAYRKELAEANAIAPIVRHIPITMPKFKLFEERWNQPVQRRFARVHNAQGGYGCGVNYGSTPEGCGIEFAARRLLRRKEARKIMLVMTDGSPGGHCYGGSSWSYLEQSKQVVKAVEAAGIDLVGIGICHDGPAGYYTNHMCFDQLEDMPKLLLALLKKFLVG